MQQFRYSYYLGTARRTRRPQDLEDAVAVQRTYWRLLGVMTLILVCVYGFITAYGYATKK